VSGVVSVLTAAIKLLKFLSGIVTVSLWTMRMCLVSSEWITIFMLIVSMILGVLSVLLRLGEC